MTYPRRKLPTFRQRQFALLCIEAGLAVRFTDDGLRLRVDNGVRAAEVSRELIDDDAYISTPTLVRQTLDQLGGGHGNVRPKVCG